MPPEPEPSPLRASSEAEAGADAAREARPGAEIEPSPETEYNTPEAPALRPGPLLHEKSDVACMILLGFLLVSVFGGVAAFFLGGAPFIIPVIAAFLIALMTPWINPAERMAPAAKWWGRVLTFLVLAGLVAAAAWWLWQQGQVQPQESD